MEQSDWLLDRVKRIARLWSIVRGETIVSRTVAIGAFTAALLIVATKFYLLAVPVWGDLLVLVLAAVSGALLAWRARLSPADAARELDRRLYAKDRIGSAVELLGTGRPAAPMVAVLVADAAQHLAGADPRSLGRRTFDGSRRALLLSLCILPAACWMPEHDLRPKREQAVSRELKAQGKRLVEVAKQTERQAKRQELRRTERAAQRLARLAADLQRRGLRKREALMKVEKLSAELKEEQKRTATVNSRQSLHRLAAEMPQRQFQSSAMQKLARALSGSDPASAADAAEDLANEVKRNGADPATAEQIEKDLDELAAALDAAGLAELARQIKAAGATLRKGDLKLTAEQLRKLLKLLAEAKRRTCDADHLGDLAAELKQCENRIATADEKCECCQGRGGDCDCGKICRKCGGLGYRCPSPSLGPGGPSAGAGTTNLEQAAGPEGQVNRERDTIPRNFPRQSAKYEEIYAPRETAVKSSAAQLHSRFSPGGTVYRSPVTVRVPPGSQSAHVPYYRVSESYQRAAAEALDKEQVPPAYRERVKTYFDSLQH